MTTDETSDFKLADQKIHNLINRLLDKRVCPCCTARALAFYAMGLAECTMGRDEAVEMFEDIIANLREGDVSDSDAPAIN